MQVFEHRLARGSLNVGEATRGALAAPHKFPRLAQSIVAGDKVALAVDRFVPAADEIVAAVVDELTTHGVAWDDVTVVAADKSGSRTTPRLATVPPSATSHRAPRFEVHDPADRGRLGYLTNTKSGRPLYLNRTLLDADVVIAIGCARGRTSWNYRGAWGGVYPTFSDDESLARFRNPRVLDRNDEVFLKSQAEVETVGWLSGAQFTVQALPGRGDDVVGVVAGDAATIAEVVDPWWNEHWVARIPQRVDTVVAALTGTHAQTWTHVGRALAAAADAVAPGGAILLCTELDQPLGPGLKQLAEVEDHAPALDRLRKQRPEDLLEAIELIEARRGARLYLLSRSDPAEIEALGITPVESAADVGRFAARSKSCLVLTDAQYAAAISDEPADRADG